MKFETVLDKNFRPMYIEFTKYVEEAKKAANKTLNICVERNDGYNYIYSYPIFEDKAKKNENCKMAERIVKTILWLVGGYKIYISGDEAVYDYIKNAYTADGLRSFDKGFMERVYESKFEVVLCDEKSFPKFKKQSMSVGGHLDGCRIGFDAGGSDRKVSAVIDGKVVYSEEVVWFPKINSDPEYHYNEILTAMKTAASKMPRVDAIGVSSAGVYVNNKIMVASLFLKVNDEDFERRVKTMYIDIAKEFDAPLEVANDGDVTALAGAIDLGDNEVLGIAMGTSEAVGYINSEGGLNGWLSELAFVPVDYNENSMVDEWSGDFGCGVKYFSQDSVIKLAEMGGFKFDEGLSPAEKLKVIQKLMADGDELAKKIYHDIGVYLGYTLPYYAMFYDIKHILLLGRVTSGEGGNIIMNTANDVLKTEFPSLKFRIEMPDEKNRRVGQSIAAASLAASRK
ncbi:MAG: ROK family protein [Clostridia bacterium]|nr:ROK family protein [Clostridia bacterium]